MNVNLKNPVTNDMKMAKVGFSWTTFFFGLWPAVFRGDFINALIILGCTAITCGIGWLVFPFIYNKMYINGLLKKGYVPADEASKNILLTKGFTVPMV